MAYVGNVAWAHICAMRTLRDKPEICGGKPYFITDDSPRLSNNDRATPFFKARNYKFANFEIPFKLAYFILMVLQALLKFIKPIKEINLPVSTKILDYVNQYHTFKRTKASKDLGYSPIFTYERILENICRILQN